MAAAGADNQAHKYAALLECNICLEPYAENGMKTPRVLRTCGHSFCTECLQRLLAQHNNKISCARCRQDTPIAKSVEDLPKNFDLLAFREQHTKQMAERDSVERPQCESCGGKCVEVSCVECDLSYCRECFAADHRRRASHKAVKWTGQRAVRSKCAFHDDLSLNLVCQQDGCAEKGKLLCLMCKEYGPVHAGHKAAPLSNVVAACRSELQKLVQALRREGEFATAAALGVEQAALAIGGDRGNADKPVRLAAAAADAVAGAGGVRTTEAAAVAAVHAAFVPLEAALQQRKAHILAQVTRLARDKLERLDAQNESLGGFVSSVYGVSAEAEELLAADDRAFMTRFEDVRNSITKASETARVLQPVADAEFAAFSIPNERDLAASLGSAGSEIAETAKPKKAVTGFWPPANRRDVGSTVFTFEAIGDDKGVMYHLGTACGTEPYQNPVLRGAVTVTLSKLNGVFVQPARGTLDLVVARDEVGHERFSCPGGYDRITLDLGAARISNVTAYTLLVADLGFWGETEWRLEGSVDSVSWTLLHDQNEGVRDCSKASRHVVDERSQTQFRYLSIVTAFGGIEWFGANFEVYGTLDFV